MADTDRVPLSAPKLDIEDDVSPDMLAALLGRIQAKWTRLGEAAPHFTVNAREAFRPEAIANHWDEFVQSGVTDANILLAILARHGLHDVSALHLCDFGCGVGRVTLPLARAFGHVTGCDISTAHLHEARRTAARDGLRNVVWSLVNARDFGLTAPCDVWYSHLVLQHNPAPVVVAVLQRAFDLLAPRGIAVFQVPTYRVGWRFDAAAYLAGPDPAEDFEIHPTPQPMIFAAAHRSGLMPLEVREDIAVWPPSVVVSNTFVFRRPA